MLAIRVRLHRNAGRNGMENTDYDEDADTHDDAVHHTRDDTEFHPVKDGDDDGRATSNTILVQQKLAKTRIQQWCSEATTASSGSCRLMNRAIILRLFTSSNTLQLDT